MIRRSVAVGHVFVFALFPILSIYSANLATYPLSIDLLLRPILVISTATTVAVLAMRIWTRDLQHRAVMLSLFLIGFLSFVLTSTLAGGYGCVQVTQPGSLWECMSGRVFCSPATCEARRALVVWHPRST